MGRISSHSREEDRKARLLMLESIEICLRNGLIEQAKDLGESSRKLAEKIKSHDYTKEDEAHKRWGREKL